MFLSLFCGIMLKYGRSKRRFYIIISWKSRALHFPTIPIESKEGMFSMKISTKGRYALRLMLDLALQPQEEYISLKDISSRQGISGKYMEQIISQLTKAGYVRSARGANGGYMLTHSADFYTVGMILRLAEGSLSPVACLDSDENTCLRAGRCVTLEVWERLKKAVDDVVDNLTLQDLVNRQVEINERIEKGD